MLRIYIGEMGATYHIIAFRSWMMSLNAAKCFR